MFSCFGLPEFLILQINTPSEISGFHCCMQEDDSLLGWWQYTPLKRQFLWDYTAQHSRRQLSYYNYISHCDSDHFTFINTKLTPYCRTILLLLLHQNIALLGTITLQELNLNPVTGSKPTLTLLHITKHITVLYWDNPYCLVTELVFSWYAEPWQICAVGISQRWGWLLSNSYHCHIYKMGFLSNSVWIWEVPTPS
jgi:hypothetical protein